MDCVAAGVTPNRSRTRKAFDERPTRYVRPYQKGGDFVDVSVISQLVQTVGFPIACVGALMYYISTQQEKMRATLEENTRAVLEMTITVKQHLCGGDENV